MSSNACLPVNFLSTAIFCSQINLLSSKELWVQSFGIKEQLGESWTPRMTLAFVSVRSQSHLFLRAPDHISIYVTASEHTTSDWCYHLTGQYLTQRRFSMDYIKILIYTNNNYLSTYTCHRFLSIWSPIRCYQCCTLTRIELSCWCYGCTRSWS